MVTIFRESFTGSHHFLAEIWYFDREVEEHAYGLLALKLRKLNMKKTSSFTKNN